MIGIIGAMSVETDGLIEKLNNVKIKKIKKLIFYSGEINGKKVVVCCCGIGKVNSSVAAAVMLMQFKTIELIINLGVAGGIKPGIKQGDIVIASGLVQHDFDQTADGLKKGQINGLDFIEFAADKEIFSKIEKILADKKYDFYTGVIASGDQFINNKEKAKQLYNDFNAFAVDMESAPIAHTCYIMNVKYLAMRAISDNADGTALLDFYSFVTEAAKKSIDVITEFIKGLSQNNT